MNRGSAILLFNDWERFNAQTGRDKAGCVRALCHCGVHFYVA